MSPSGNEVLSAGAQGHPEARQKTDAGRIEVLGGEASSATTYAVSLFMVTVTMSGLFYTGIRAGIALATMMVAFMTTRHLMLIRNRQSVSRAWDLAKARRTPDVNVLPAVYFTYILGSGGHTGELYEVMFQQYKPNAALHRRYVITAGDSHSLHALAELETRIHGPSVPQELVGTWDVFRVARARRVHQPFWTAPYTSLLSALSIIQALTRPPKARPRASFKYPHIILTNGPGTGFIVCFVAHLLKIFYLVPKGRMQVVYLETWAHISTLSLTGKLFYYANIADIFMVQHKQLADKTNMRFVGEVTKRGNLLGIGS